MLLTGLFASGCQQLGTPKEAKARGCHFVVPWFTPTRNATVGLGGIVDDLVERVEVGVVAGADHGCVYSVNFIVAAFSAILAFTSFCTRAAGRALFA